MGPAERQFFHGYFGVVIAGVIIGAGAVSLQLLGNPPNLGLCLGCFIRDTAGAIGLHRAAVAQYIRPELTGVVLGAMAAAVLGGQWRSRAGSTPFISFTLGIFAMVGILVFLGCPWRVLLRLGGGDLNGAIGLAGLVVGSVGAGLLIKKGYPVAETTDATPVAGVIFPVMMLILLFLLALEVTFKPGLALFFSNVGPGSMMAPMIASLAVGLLVGILAQRSRFCIVGALRLAALERRFVLLVGVLALVVTVVAMNMAIGRFKVGLVGMPISHTDYVWSFLATVLSGLAFTLGGGCPGRQLVRAGEGDGDAAVFCAGMFFGAGLCHNWALTAAPDKMIDGSLAMGGPGIHAMIAVWVGIVFCVLVGILGRRG